ncbi:pyridoxamine 5'-phosphate oxidase family protein [Aneurinibacillus migulanus]|uniref:pyridoxamine 5'-phosphate oxidase family protein n=1 Tax=Aneurinibacillus migulanus TaxID=47500 RepID=UPI0020A15EB0|nr:pyridoxamine 5'-phosphate oxidase family protein [Aneurinibacillus migulanus]MCP1355734.1 pyridoxamine 5'-phosphate oxidase family protein [Aneurinibacillus migulanus]
MAEVVAQSLSQELLALLQDERFAMLSTVNRQSGGPYVSAISWVYASNVSTICFAVNSKSVIVENIQHNSHVVLNVFARGSVYSISGHAHVKAERMENVPLKLTLIEVMIEEVRDVMFYGSRIAVEPHFEKTYDAHAAEKLDNQVMEALKNA